MKETKINKNEFKAWADTQFVRYASEGITTGDLRKLLVFEASVSGKYRVKFGNTILYEGDNLGDAATVYNNVN